MSDDQSLATNSYRTTKSALKCLVTARWDVAVSRWSIIYLTLVKQKDKHTSSETRKSNPSQALSSDWDTTQWWQILIIQNNNIYLAVTGNMEWRTTGGDINARYTTPQGHMSHSSSVPFRICHFYLNRKQPSRSQTHFHIPRATKEPSFRASRGTGLSHYCKFMLF